jgi:lipopolysaccharide export system protein LptA
LECVVAHALQSDADQPIHIESDDAEIDQNNETIIYTGSVKVIQGSLTVSGERMVVDIKNDQVERITTLGSPAKYSQQLEDDQGTVRASADSIIYHTNSERVVLEGRAEIEQLGSTLRGESIRYNIVQGRIDANGNQGERVRMQLDPARVRPTTDDAE